MPKTKAKVTADIIARPIKNNGAFGESNVIGFQWTWNDGDVELNFTSDIPANSRVFLKSIDEK